MIQKSMRAVVRRALLLGALGLVLAGNAGEAKARGTHFVVEPYAGAVFNQGLSREDAVGLESGVFFGVGGKLKGFPPRFYLYVRGSQTFFGEDDVFVSSRQAQGTVRRSYTRVVGGLRTVIPLWGYLRLNLSLGGGSMFSQNKYQEAGMRLIEYNEDLTVMELGVGLNLRLYSWLSVGLNYDYTFVAEDEHGDFIAHILSEANSGAELGWSHLSLSLGFHF